MCLPHLMYARFIYKEIIEYVNTTVLWLNTMPAQLLIVERGLSFHALVHMHRPLALPSQVPSLPRSFPLVKFQPILQDAQTCLSLLDFLTPTPCSPIPLFLYFRLYLMICYVIVSTVFAIVLSHLSLQGSGKLLWVKTVPQCLAHVVWPIDNWLNFWMNCNLDKLEFA